jgi:hypothetical protein
MEPGNPDHVVGVGGDREPLDERRQGQRRHVAQLAGLLEADEVLEDVGIDGRNDEGVARD